MGALKRLGDNFDEQLGRLMVLNSGRVRRVLASRSRNKCVLRYWILRHNDRRFEFGRRDHSSHTNRAKSPEVRRAVFGGDIKICTWLLFVNSPILFRFRTDLDHFPTFARILSVFYKGTSLSSCSSPLRDSYSHVPTP